MKSKRIIAGIVGLAIAMSCLPLSFDSGLCTSITANAEASGTCGDNVSWVLSDDGVLTISGVGEMKAGTTFKGNSFIRSVVIKDRVKTISGYAFYECENISSVTIPSSLNKIESDAFYKCKNLKSIVIPDSVLEIDTYAFAYTSLAKVALPRYLKKIRSSSFSSCKYLESVTIPNTVTYIDEYAFSYCDSLTDVYYLGSPAEWSMVNNQSKNIKKATIHFNPTASTSKDIGDLNKDGKIDSKDAVMVLKDYAQALATGGGAGNPTGDVNKDGKEDSKDAVLILRYYASVLAKIYTGSIENFK